MKPMVIAAPNGAQRGKADHAALPVSIAQIAAEAALCHQAGAAALHLHIRDDTCAHSLDTGLYRAATQAIAETAPGMLVQITTEAAGIYGLAAQIACVKAVRPKAVSVAWREFAPEENPAARRFYDWAADAGIHVQHILYSPEDIARFNAFGLESQSVLLVLGKYSGAAATVADLPAYLNELGEVHDWCVCAFGPAEHAVVSAAIAAGGHARVGFENNLHRADGSLAAGTFELVAQIENDVSSAAELCAFWGIENG